MPWPIDALPYPFELGFMQRALVASVVVGVFAPMIGTFVVQKKMSLIGDGIGHLAFAGVGAGLVAGVSPIWAALVVAVAGALGIEWLRSRRTASGDLALALFFYSAIVAVMLVLRRGLFAVVTDEDWSRVAGLPVGLLNTVLAVIVAASVVAAMRIVGLLLVAAMMVLPVASGQLLARSFRGTLWWSVAIGVASVVAGLAASRIWGLAPGGTIVLISGAIFVAVALVRRARVPKLQAEGAGL
jgi:zinc transport system permease protein